MTCGPSTSISAPSPASQARQHLTHGTTIVLEADAGPLLRSTRKLGLRSRSYFKPGFGSPKLQILKEVKWVLKPAPIAFLPELAWAAGQYRDQQTIGWVSVQNGTDTNLRRV